MCFVVFINNETKGHASFSLGQYNSTFLQKWDCSSQRLGGYVEAEPASPPEAGSHAGIWQEGGRINNVKYAYTSLYMYIYSPSMVSKQWLLKQDDNSGHGLVGGDGTHAPLAQDLGTCWFHF